MQKNEENLDFVASLAKGLEVIRSFDTNAPKQTLSDVAERTGYSRATARRFLHTLTKLGYATSDGKYFQLTPQVLTLGFSYISSIGIWNSVQVYLEEITKKTNESANIATLDHNQVVYVSRSASPHRIISVALHLGSRLPAHATSMGLVLLCNKSEKEICQLYPEKQLEKFTSRTITQRKQLIDRLKVVEQHGYSMVDQELETGLRSLAVPLTDSHGSVRAALNISTHSFRISKTKLISEYLPIVRETATKIEQFL